MDTTLWIIVAVVIVITLVIYRYRREVGLSVKGWGVQAKLQGKGAAETAKPPAGSRNVSTGAGRNVSIGGNAQGNTIVTGDDNKIGH